MRLLINILLIIIPIELLAKSISYSGFEYGYNSYVITKSNTSDNESTLCISKNKIDKNYNKCDKIDKENNLYRLNFYETEIQVRQLPIFIKHIFYYSKNKFYLKDFNKIIDNDILEYEKINYGFALGLFLAGTSIYFTTTLPYYNYIKFRDRDYTSKNNLKYGNNYFYKLEHDFILSNSRFERGKNRIGILYTYNFNQLHLDDLKLNLVENHIAFFIKYNMD